MDGTAAVALILVGVVALVCVVLAAQLSALGARVAKLEEEAKGRAAVNGTPAQAPQKRRTMWD
jgi:hypothetical protein